MLNFFMINFWDFERKNRFKSLFILFLIFLLFVIGWRGAFLITKLFLGLKIDLPFYIFFVIALLSFVFYLHRSGSTIRDFLFAINALPIDLEDFRHRRAQNIINEISISAGIQPPRLYIFPSYIKNAFTVKLDKEHVIALSEGVVGNMRRDEIQAIVAHEIGHIVNKDTELKTFIASISGALYSAKSLLGFTKTRGANVSVKTGSRTQFGGLYIVIMYLYIKLVMFFTRILSMMISREREYLADMKSVEFTRNPEAMARALYVIEHDRIKQIINLTHPSFSMLFLVNPIKDSIEVKNNLFSRLFTTHPPTIERIKRMLQLAHLQPGEFYVKTMKERMEKRKEQAYFIKDGDEWKGPFTLSELKEKFEDYHTLEVFTEMFGKERLLFKGEKSGYICPRCGGALYNTYYEDIPIQMCENCKGVLIKSVRLKRSLIREDYHPGRDVDKQKIKEAFLIKKKTTGKTEIKDFDPSEPFNCPVCGQQMARFFYSYETPIVVDFCYKCSLYFLDDGELDILQR